MTLVRVWWGLGILLVIVALVVCLVPFAPSGGPRISDKVSHLVGHGGLAIYFAGLVPRARWWKIFVFLLLFGIGVEFAQASMGLGREGDIRDVLANSLGAALGLLLAWLGLARWPELAAWVFGRRSSAS